MKLYLMMFLAGSLPSFGETIASRQDRDNKPKSDNRLQISIHPVVPFNHKRPAIIVRYYNADKKPISLTLPRDRHHVLGEFLTDETGTFRELSVEIDGFIEAEFQIDDQGETVWTRGACLAPGQHIDLELQLDDIYRIPEDWRTIEIRTSRISLIEAKVIGNLKLERISHTFLDPIHVTAAPVLPMDFDDPRIVVRFYNFGKKTFHLPLPKVGSEKKMFWSVSSVIDRKKVHSFGRNSPIGGYRKWTRFVDLKPGKGTKIKLRLKDYFKIPKDWKLIEIDTGDFSLPKKGGERFMNPEYQNTLTLTRPLQQPASVPYPVWYQSNDRVRWFLVKQQKHIDTLKAQRAKKR